MAKSNLFVALKDVAILSPPVGIVSSIILQKKRFGEMSGRKKKGSCEMQSSCCTAIEPVAWAAIKPYDEQNYSCSKVARQPERAIDIRI